MRDVTYLPSCPANSETLTLKDMRDSRLLHLDGWQRNDDVRFADCISDVELGEPRKHDDITSLPLVDSGPTELAIDKNFSSLSFGAFLLRMADNNIVALPQDAGVNTTGNEKVRSKTASRLSAMALGSVPLAPLIALAYTILMSICSSEAPRSSIRSKVASTT